ncbi:hypothetical protein KCP78_23440 [Salmonella enterica subsp. enterica]|nr:hypothetical protein KCP78_23440 [Salmonella enterica subsp. enterica]
MRTTPLAGDMALPMRHKMAWNMNMLLYWLFSACKRNAEFAVTIASPASTNSANLLKAKQK